MSSKPKFKVGQRVRVTWEHTQEEEGLLNEAGTIVEVKASDFLYGVQMDKESLGLHDCSGKAKKGAGRYLEEVQLELEEEKPFGVEGEI